MSDVQLGGKPGVRERILLEGPLGAGKTTVARVILRALLSASGPARVPAPTALIEAGSPTFALVHEYPGGWRHLDLYRLEREAELDATGALEGEWGRQPGGSLIEWSERLPALREELLVASAHCRVWRISLEVLDPQTRRLTIRERVAASVT